MTTLHDALERRVSATRAASSLQGVLQRHVETLRWALLESHRASGLLDLNVTEANLREEPADVAGPYVSGTRRRYRPAWRALNVCKSGGFPYDRGIMTLCQPITCIIDKSGVRTGASWGERGG